MFLLLACSTAKAIARQTGPSERTAAGENREISVKASMVYRWPIGNAQASLLEGDCVLTRRGRTIHADKILIVSDGPQGKVRNRIVIEGMYRENGRQEPQPRPAVWTTIDSPEIEGRFRGRPAESPFLMQFLPPDSIKQVGGEAVAQVQFTEPVPDPNVTLATPQTFPNEMGLVPPSQSFQGNESSSRGNVFFFGGGTKGLEITARGAANPPSVGVMPRPETGESILVARGGVTLRIQDVSAQLSGGQLLNFGTVTISADRVVGWLPSLSNVFQGQADLSSAEGELYLEGDIVFRQGENVIYAESMYYNVSRETGMVLDAEAITTIPEYQGVVRLKAEVLQQVSRGNYLAFDAAVTSSRLGVPRYWLQSERLDFYEQTRTGIDQATGRVVADTDPFVRTTNSFIFLGGLPVFYWPRFTTSLERPVFYLRGAKVRNDNTFGTQVLLDWDVFQLLGISNVPEGVDWELSTNYLSDRGPAFGTNLDYDLPGFFGYPGRTRGILDVWGIDDTGVDRLGQGRLAVEPEERYRGRALWRHRQQLPGDFEFIGQLGWISDRNFLEQYFENEWDQSPDHVTELRLRKYYYNQLFDLAAQPQLNDFFMETERLPSLDHYLLGANLGRLTWSMRNHVSYSRLNAADDPEDPVQAANHFPLPGEMDAEGILASTRQQLSLDLDLGPFSLRPIASFEAAHYGEAADGQSLTRLLGQGGLQINLPMVRVDPTIESALLNVRGLAHKMNWEAEYWYADSNADLDELPFYDPLDDNAQEQFRRRFIGDTFGGALPSRFDPRTYAFRHGIQRNVTSPSSVIADDLQQMRFGLSQRFQTKRGLRGRERIVDLVQFDVSTYLFPDADRDNFGETVGPTTYDFRYHLGDRFSILSDGYIDFFDDGLRSISAGLRASRPGVSDFYMGLLSLEGPVSSTVLRTSVDYRLNEKWIFSGGTTYDFGSAGNVGQSFGITGIGESLLVRLNVNIDPGRDNVGFGFVIEPRLFARRLGQIGGGMIPPPGLEGLE
ncbi:MAG: organic solvent tolerance protein OstA [Planctomycetota bacterium]